MLDEKYHGEFDGYHFAGYSKDYKDSRIIFIPIAFQGTVSYGQGTFRAPYAIIQASQQLENYDEDIDKQIFDEGFHTLKIQYNDNVNAKEVIDKTEAICREVINDNKFPFVIGGEHSISLAPVRAFSKAGKRFTVVQFDAHTDLSDSLHNNKYSHACVSRRIIEECNADIVQIGIRNLSKELKNYIDNSNKVKVFYAKDIVKGTDEQKRKLINEIISSIKDDYVYITFDVDVFDPSLIPCTGTPEPGGLQWYDVLDIISEIAKRKKVIGSDVVELAPYEHNPSCDYTIAKLIYKMLGLVYKNN